MQQRDDVIVIGAGLSGLAAATALLAAGVRSLTVLEAGPQVGGRTRTSTVGGFESGMQGWFLYYVDGTAHAFTLGRMGNLRLLSKPWMRPVVRGAWALLWRWMPLPMSAAAVTDLLGAVGKLDLLAASIPIERPWSAPRSGCLPAMPPTGLRPPAPWPMRHAAGRRYWLPSPTCSVPKR